MPHPPSYWQDTCKKTDSLSLEGPVNTDTLVIGAGYTGLSAALELADAGVATTLLDAHEPGFGCAGRNGGFVLSGTGRLSVAAIEKTWGMDIAQGMKDEFDAAVSLLLSRIRSADIQCDLSAGPYYKIAHTPRQAARMREALTHMKSKYKADGEFLSAAMLCEELQVHSAYGAVKTQGHALHPLKLATALVSLIKNAGVQVFHRSPALSIQKITNGYCVRTPEGEVRAKHLLLATNAYSPATFHRQIDKKHFPVQSSILVTAPLTPQQQALTGLNKPMTMMDTRLMKYYYRVLPDGRLLFGGRGAVTGQHADSQASRNRLYNGMCGAFPALKGIRQAYFWSGWVSVSLDNLPRIRYHADDSCGYAMGYCGSGVSFSALAGKRLAQLRLGQKVPQSLPLYADDLKQFPLASLRRAALFAMYTYAALTNS